MARGGQLSILMRHCVTKEFNSRTDNIEIVRYTGLCKLPKILESMLALSFDSWLVWRQRVDSERVAQQALRGLAGE
jgi:hypothetical protein